jgi:hypothetical protein
VLRRRARIAAGPLFASLAFAWGSRASAQAQPADERSAAPSAVPPAEETHAEPPVVKPDEPPVAEFPDVMQGGVVTGKPNLDLRPWPTQRNFALIATEGSFNGFGLGVRAGTLRLGVEAAFTFSPILATYVLDPEAAPDFKILWGFQGNATMFVGLHRLDARTDLGIAFGYKYSTLLRHGATVAFYFQRELGSHWVLTGFVGPCIFPAAEDQIRKETGWVGGSVLSGIAWHQSGVGLSIAFFP